MRLKLTLEHEPGTRVPLHYPYLISSWIYSTIGESNTLFASWLHERGYRYGERKYKLFTYGPIQPRRFTIDDRVFILSAGPSELILSFYLEEAVEHLVTGLFRDQAFSLGDRDLQADFMVRSIEVLPKPVWQETMRFRAVTPVCISQDEPGKRYAQYRHPDHPGYGELILQNLVRKQKSLTRQPAGPIDLESYLQTYLFEILSTPRSKLFRIKGTQVRGYLYEFRITASAELLELGYYTGFGEKNSSLGMGCVELVE